MLDITEIPIANYKPSDLQDFINNKCLSENLILICRHNLKEIVKQSKQWKYEDLKQISGKGYYQVHSDYVWLLFINQIYPAVAFIPFINQENIDHYFKQSTDLKII